MGYHFRGPHVEMPELLRSWTDPRIWKLVELVEQLDVSGFEQDYRADGCGGQPYSPRLMLVSVWWCYQQGTRAPNQIAHACREHLSLRAVWGRDQVPSGATFRRFIGTHPTGWQRVHLGVLSTCAHAGLVEVTTTATDSTPVRAPTALSSLKNAPMLTVAIDETQQQLDRVRAQAAAAAHHGHVDECCQWLRRREARLLARLDQLREAENIARALDQQAPRSPPKVQQLADRVAKHRTGLHVMSTRQQQALDAYQAKVAAGRKPRGPAPRPPEQHPHIRSKAGLLARAEALLHQALTNPDPPPRNGRKLARVAPHDPHSRLLKGKNTTTWVLGRLLTLTTGLGQVLLAAILSPAGNDQGGLHPNLSAAADNCRRAGITTTPQHHLADAGFASTATFTTPSPFSGELYIAVTNHTDQLDNRLPATIPPGHEEMAARLSTKQGAALYRLRSPMIEPIFAHLLRTDRRLHTRGQAQHNETLALASSHNAAKYLRYRHSRARPRHLTHSGT